MKNVKSLFLALVLVLGVASNLFGEKITRCDVSIFLKDGSRYELSEEETQKWQEFVNSNPKFSRVKDIKLFMNSIIFSGNLAYTRVMLEGEHFPLLNCSHYDDSAEIIDIVIIGTKNLLGI